MATRTTRPSSAAASRPPLVAALMLAAACAMGATTTAYAQSPDTNGAAQPGASTPARVSAFAWLRPRDGVVVLAGPSTDLGYRIAHLDVAEGDRVKQGQPLAELDVRRERAATLAIATAQVHAAQVNADFAARELARKKRLASAPSQAVSEQVLDAARHVAELATVQLEIAERQQAHDRIMLDQATIRAPADGMVLRILKQEGEGLTPSEGLIELGQVARMEAVAEVFDTDVRFVRPGQPAQFDSKALAAPARGKVLRIMPKLDRVKLYETNAGESVENRVVRVVVALVDDPAVERLTGLQGIVTIDTSKAP